MTIPLNEICRLVSLQLGVRNVKGSDLIQENLGAESVDLVNIIATVEETYQIEIDEAELAAIRTVADLHRLVV
ncbi:MAG: acyl carrier protein [Chloroflexi bacterium]|nr:acyl carrier protein [Chloroflexota bacterium]